MKRFEVTHPKTLNDLPPGEHFLFLYTDSVYIPGNPGHGYPESTHESWRIERYASKEEWTQAIELIMRHGDEYRKKFVPLHCIRPTIETTVKVKVV